MRALLHSSWIGLLCLALLVGGLTYYVGWTPSGLQRLVSLANRRLGPVTLHISGARGSLNTAVHFDTVIVEHRRVRVEAHDVNGRVALLPLLWQSIHVLQAQIGTVQVHVLPVLDTGGAPWQPHFLIGLLTLRAEHATLGRCEVITPNGYRQSAEQLHGAAALDVSNIDVFDSDMLYGGVLVQGKGRVHAANPLQIVGTLRLSMSAADQPAWLANAQLDGDLNRLGITGNLLTPFTADFHGAARALTGNWHWLGETQIRAFDLRVWGIGGALGVVSGAMHLEGDHRGFSARGELTPPGLRSGPLSVDFSGNYAERLLGVTKVSVTHPASGSHLNATGTVGIVSGGPRLDLQGQWRAVRWPLKDAAAPVGSASGAFALKGLWPFALHASGDLRVLDLPSMHFSTQGQLRRDGLDLNSTALDAFDGQALMHGQVRWSPTETWTLSGGMNRLNVARLRPGVSGRLNFALQASGQGFDVGRTLQAQISNLTGNVRAQPASGHARVALQGNAWQLQQVRLKLGATRIDVDGSVGQRLDLQFAIDAADLALLRAGASGRLRAQGRIRGDTRQPVVQGELHATGIDWGGDTLQAADVKVDFDPHGTGRADATLRLSKLKIADRHMDVLRLVSTGMASAHRFELSMQAPALSVQASGSGSFNEGLWRGQIEALSARDDEAQVGGAGGSGSALHFTAIQPAALIVALDGSVLELGRLCLSNDVAQLCAAARTLAGRRHFEINASRVPLRTLTAGLSTDTDFEGTVSVSVHGDAEPSAPWQGALTGSLTAAKLTHRLLGGRVESFNLGGGSVGAELTGIGLDARVALDAGSLGNINGHLLGRRTGEPWRDWPIGGELLIQTQSLSFVESYVAQVDRISGTLNANLILTGSLSAPSFDGDLKISGAQVDAYQYNLALRDIQLDARLHDNTLQLDGHANAGTDGTGRINGALAWRHALPYGELHLSGQNLRIVNIPEARVQASPEVDMKFSGRRLDVTGSIAVPYARFERPDQLANAVRASNDEILVSAKAPVATAAFLVFSDLTLKLGERVTIDTLGLTGRLSGTLRTVTDDTGFDRGTGELQIEEGKYTALGRRLDIERGRLMFSDGPLNDPAIDLRAVKKFPDITAGVNVRGTLRKPRMTFFSDPSVAQSQIVSLLLAGGSLESVQNTADPTQRNNTARSNLLLQGSAMLFQQYGAKVGLDDVGVESDLNNDTALVLGRYLSPRLYVSYGVSLAESINTIKMRYTISDHWTIKTEASTGTARAGADLVYTIEH